MTTIAFFNNKGGVGKTTLGYHLSWMYADLGASVVVADLDPQANLTAMFLSEDRLEELWPDGEAAEMREADVVLIDVGPNLGAINRAAIIAANFVVFPLAPDLFSLQGLRNLGPTLREWRKEWKDRTDRWRDGSSLSLPSADITPAGYIVMRHAVRAGRPVQAYQKWLHRIPEVYRAEILGDVNAGAVPGADGADAADVNCLATLKHYRSLMPMAQEARKPIFHLKAADGALGGHIYAVQECYDDFMRLSFAIADKCGVSL